MADLLRLFDLDGATRIRFVSGYDSVVAARSKSLPSPVSLEEFFRLYCDLHRPLAGGLLRKLAALCDESDSKLRKTKTFVCRF